MVLPKFTIGTSIILLFFTLLLGANWFYGAYAGQVREVLFIYIVLIGFPLFFYDVDFKFISEDLTGKGMAFGLLGFAAFYGIFTALFKLMPTIGATLASFETLKVLGLASILLVVAKAIGEELVFRKILPSIGRWGLIVTSVLFGFFHFFVLTTTGLTGWTLYLSLFWLSLLGYIWGWMVQVKKLSLMSVIGSHIGYNLAILLYGTGASLLPSLIQ